jgi:hypothetical protein
VAARTNARTATCTQRRAIACESLMHALQRSRTA